MERIIEVRLRRELASMVDTSVLSGIDTIFYMSPNVDELRKAAIEMHKLMPVES